MEPHLKDQYTLQMQKMKLKDVDASMLSQHQMYIISTPITLFLWLGKELDQSKKLGSLRIMKAFTQGMLNENLEFFPGYSEKGT